jgi:hypothetical protein
MRIENLIAFAKNFVFAEEKLSKVFPGLIEAFLAHEYIYGIYASQREIFLQPTRASGKNISVTPLSAHEMDVLFGSLAQALDLLRPFAEQALSLIYEEPIVLKVCDYEFRESKDAPLETTDLPDVTALVEELASNTTSISKVRGSNNKAKRKRRNQAKKRAAVVMNMRNQEQNLPDAVVVTTILTSTTNSTTTVANENEILAILNNIGDREEKAYDSAETIPSDDAREVTELAPIVQTKIDSPLDSTLETRKEVVARRRKSSIPQFMLEPNSNRDSQQASISKKVVNRTSDEKLITCLERKNVISILGELSSRNMRLLKEIFDHSSVNLKYSAQEIYVLAESIAAIIDKKYDSTIALQFLKQLSNHLHPSHKASDYGDKLKNDYVDKLRPFFIMAGIYPADWAPQTANDVEAKQKYFLRLLEAKKRNQFS